MKIEGYTDKPEPRRSVSLEGKARELEDLAAEIQRWTPTIGWSERAQALFRALTRDRTEWDHE